MSATATAPRPPATYPTADPISVLPLAATRAGLRRFTLAEYHALIRAGVLTEKERTVLIEGYLVHKMVIYPPHAVSLNRLRKLMDRLAPGGWDTRLQSPITLPTDDSEPEPDYAIVRGSDADYGHRHPGPAEVGLIVEVADSSLDVERTDSQRIYARAGIPIYWIVNVPDRQIEVYTDPQPAANPPAYGTLQIYRTGDAVPVVLDGAAVGTVPVADVLP